MAFSNQRVTVFRQSGMCSGVSVQVKCHTDGPLISTSYNKSKVTTAAVLQMSQTTARMIPKGHLVIDVNTICGCDAVF